MRGGGAAELVMALTRRAEEGTREARLGFLLKVALGFGLAAVVVAGMVEWALDEGASEIREGFRWMEGVGAGAGAGAALGGGGCCVGWAAGRNIEATEGFLRN